MIVLKSRLLPKSPSENIKTAEYGVQLSWLKVIEVQRHRSCYKTIEETSQDPAQNRQHKPLGATIRSLFGQSPVGDCI